MKRSKLLSQLLRIHQWSKNLPVFAPMIFAAAFTPEAAAKTISAFFAMCFLSSAVYIFNDIADRETDRTNPSKQNRPIAAGLIAPGTAAAAAAICLVMGFIIGILTGGWQVLLCYLVLNAAYTLHLKHLPVIDTMCIAAGFVLRLLLGGQVIHVPVTSWLIVMVFFFSLFMAFGKRKCELKQEGITKRKVIASYTLPMLEKLENSSAVIGLTAYILFTLDGGTIAKFQAPHLYFTVPIVTYCIYRYRMITENDRDGDPSAIIFREPSIFIGFLVWLAVCLAIIFLHL